MPDVPGRNSEMWNGVRRGTGWAVGVGAALTAASVLRDGPREALKGVLKAGLRGREMAAEASERLRDICAEVRSEQGAPAEATDATNQNGARPGTALELLSAPIRNRST